MKVARTKTGVTITLSLPDAENLKRLLTEACDCVTATVGMQMAEDTMSANEHAAIERLVSATLYRFERDAAQIQPLINELDSIKELV